MLIPYLNVLYAFLFSSTIVGLTDNYILIGAQSSPCSFVCGVEYHVIDEETENCNEDDSNRNQDNPFPPVWFNHIFFSNMPFLLLSFIRNLDNIVYSRLFYRNVLDGFLRGEVRNQFRGGRILLHELVLRGIAFV